MKHNQVLGSTTKVIYRTKMSLVAPPNAGLRFISPRWSTTKCLGAQPKSFIAQKWAWLRPQTLGCASSRLDEAQPWKMIFFKSSLVNLCLPDHRLFCLSKNLKESVKKQKDVTFVSFFPLSLSVFFLSFFSFYSAFVFFRFCCFAFSLFRRWYFFSLFSSFSRS